MHAYGFFGSGASGTTDDLDQALKWLANNNEGAIYIRIDLAAELTQQRTPPTRVEICECGHRAATHTPCCVYPCGCDGFTTTTP